ncbi:MAG: alpha-ketoglutarate-dependent dioxygenase AlkB [Bacteroidetes bacterium]|nr:alpha-ketoglutarate-dependent dioxygenase AlkB [Bacteroidota bacterium]
MDLFNKHQTNLLPKDGVVQYFGKVISTENANQFMEALIKNIEWKNDEVVIYGKRIITKRKMAWYGDKAFEYKYSNIIRTALPWTSELLELKATVETISNENYNSCLLNLYHDGNEGMGWHSDDEKDLKKDGAIASLSLGADRKFGFKHKQDKQSLYLTLEHGSLLLMKEQVQSHWLHSLPKTSKVLKPRINLTFRTIV